MSEYCLPVSRGNKRSSDGTPGDASVDAAAATSTSTSIPAGLASPAPGAKVQKRSDPIQWDDYFMAIAYLSAMRSKDPSTQVGACIVNQDKRIVGMGYNGFPRGCSDDELPWCRHAENELDTKYPVRLYPFLHSILQLCMLTGKSCVLLFFVDAVCMPCGGERDPQQEQRRRQGLHSKHSSIICSCTHSPPLQVHVTVVSQLPATCMYYIFQIYVALFPCNECAKLIIQSGISEVVYLSDKYRDTPSMQASRRMMTMAGVCTSILSQCTVHLCSVFMYQLFMHQYSCALHNRRHHYIDNLSLTVLQRYLLSVSCNNS